MCTLSPLVLHRPFTVSMSCCMSTNTCFVYPVSSYSLNEDTNLCEGCTTRSIHVKGWACQGMRNVPLPRLNRPLKNAAELIFILINTRFSRPSYRCLMPSSTRFKYYPLINCKICGKQTCFTMLMKVQKNPGSIQICAKM